MNMLFPRCNLRYLVPFCQLLILVLVATGCRQTGTPSTGIPFSSRPPTKIQPSDVTADVQLALAQALELNGKTDRAIAAYEKIIAAKALPEAMHRLAVLYDQQGEFDQAHEFYSKALKQRPDDAELLCDIGYSYYLQQNWKLSESHLRQAVKIDPKMERAHNNLGLLLARMNQPDEALASFRSGASTDDVALSNFNFVFAESKQASLLSVADDSHAPPAPMVHAQPTPLERKTISPKDVKLPSPPGNTGLPQHVNYELPPAHPALIASEELESEPVKLADFSQTQPSSGSSVVDSVNQAVPSPDHAAPSLGRPPRSDTDLVDPVKVEIPPHWSKFFPEP